MPLKGSSRFPLVVRHCICEWLKTFYSGTPFVSAPFSPSNFLNFSQARQQSGSYSFFSASLEFFDCREPWQDKDCGTGTGPSAPIVCFTRELLCQSSLPLPRLISKEICGLPGAGPRGGVQHCVQQGVPLPDKNRFLCARATQITFSASLSFLVSVAPDPTPEAFCFALWVSAHTYVTVLSTLLFSVSFLLLLAVGSALP